MKIKKTLVLLLSLSVLASVFGQKRASDKFFEEIKTNNGVVKISIDNLESLQFEDYEKVYAPFEIKVHIFNKVKHPDSENETGSYFKKSPFNEVKPDKSENGMRVFTNQVGKSIYECHVCFMEENKLFLISYFGDFKVEDLKTLKGMAKSFYEMGKSLK